MSQGKRLIIVKKKPLWPIVTKIALDLALSSQKAFIFSKFQTFLPISIL